MHELWRQAGAQFDLEVVQALTAAMPVKVQEKRVTVLPPPAAPPRLAVVAGRRMTAS